MRSKLLLLVLILAARPEPAQTAASVTASVPSPADAVLDAAEAWVGRALVVRGGYAAGDLSFDPAGQVKGRPRVVDWTLAGFDLQKVQRHGAEALEFDGVRVAIRYNPDQHLFERHPLKQEHVRILLALPAPATAQTVESALQAIFSTGIDPALQRAMPPYWRHYFEPALSWPADDLTGQTILPAAGKLPEGASQPVVEHRAEPEFTLEARQDRVKGTVQVRLVVDRDGTPKRIAIRQPLGYGLDERTVEAIARYRFRPATQNGQPVAAEIIVNQAFQ